MRKANRAFASLLGTAAAAGLVATGHAAAEQNPTRILFDNGSVRVQEVTFKPGAEGPNVPRPFRVIRVLEGGTMERTYPDGKVESVEYRKGDVKVYEADKPFVPKNVGKNDIVLYVVAVREAKK